MEYYCHVWAGAPSCYLELLDKLQKRICRTVGPSLAASLETLAHCENVASLRFFIGITLVDVLLSRPNCFSLTYNPNGFKPRINRKLLKAGYFCILFVRFSVYFNLFVLYFLVTSCFVVAVQPCME